MVCTQTKTYAMMRSNIIEWEKFASENAWANEALEEGQWSSKNTTEQCLAVYYVVDTIAQVITNKLHVVTWLPEYRREFKDLNLLWVESLFEVEDSDIQQLEYPEDSFLKSGGQIFFLLEDKKVAGTVAMMIHNGECELGKLTVASQYQGRGFAHPLMQESIDWAKREGHPSVILLSSVKLVKAISLYKKYGFETVHLGKYPGYDRCDIVMRLVL